MYKMKWLFVLLFVIVTVNISCQSEDKQKNIDDFNITVEELKSVIETDTTLIILDVRTPRELDGVVGKIKGVINIPVQVLAKRLGELEKYKEKNIAVICRSGNRSVAATKIMKTNGFKAKNVLGGMRAYNKLVLQAN